MRPRTSASKIPVYTPPICFPQGAPLPSRAQPLIPFTAAMRAANQAPPRQRPHRVSLASRSAERLEPGSQHPPERGKRREGSALKAGVNAEGAAAFRLLKSPALGRRPSGLGRSPGCRRHFHALRMARRPCSTAVAPPDSDREDCRASSLPTPPGPQGFLTFPISICR